MTETAGIVTVILLAPRRHIDGPYAGPPRAYAAGIRTAVGTSEGRRLIKRLGAPGRWRSNKLVSM